MTVDMIPKVIEDVRGDSTWLTTSKIVKTIIDPKESGLRKPTQMVQPVRGPGRRLRHQPGMGCQRASRAQAGGRRGDHDVPRLLTDRRCHRLGGLQGSATVSRSRSAYGKGRPANAAKHGRCHAKAWMTPCEKPCASTGWSPFGETPATCWTTRPACTIGIPCSMPGIANTGDD